MSHDELRAAHERLKAMVGSGYLQVDEISVKVIDPDVQG